VGSWAAKLGGTGACRRQGRRVDKATREPATVRKDGCRGSLPATGRRASARIFRGRGRRGGPKRGASGSGEGRRARDPAGGLEAGPARGPAGDGEDGGGAARLVPRGGEKDWG
jgi:hypothetical protein